MHFSQAKEIAMCRAHEHGKVPLTRREHVNHVIESHWTFVSILEISRVTWIIIEMWTLYNHCWNVCRWRRSLCDRCHSLKGMTLHKVKSMQIKSDIATTKMLEMNKYNWGGIGIHLKRHNWVRELEASWVSRIHETLVDDYLVASSVDLLTSPGLVILLKLELQQDWIELRLTYLAELWIRLLSYLFIENCS